MAKEVAKAAAKDKAPKKQKEKRPNIFKRAVRYVRDVVSELKKVTWPTRKDTISYSTIVLVFVVIMGLITFAIDSILSAGLDWIMG